MSLEVEEEHFVGCLEVTVDILGETAENGLFHIVKDYSIRHVRKWLDLRLRTFIRPLHRREVEREQIVRYGLVDDVATEDGQLVAVDGGGVSESGCWPVLVDIVFGGKGHVPFEGTKRSG